MKRIKDLFVTKRDDTVERFAFHKLLNCLRDSLESRGYDPRLATPLAKAVEMHLVECRAGEPIGTDYIFKCVSSVLGQTGLGDVADDMIQFRRQRESRRRKTRVLPGVDNAGLRSLPWNKSAIIATLENQYGLRHNVARFLASRVEEQVFSLNYRTITKPFLAEVVRNEVLAWGLAGEDLMRKDAIALELPLGPTGPGKAR